MTHSHVDGQILLCKVRAAFHGDRARRSATGCATGALQTRTNKSQQGLASSGEAFCKAPRRRQPKKRSFASGEKTLAPASVFMAARSRTGPGAQKKLTNPEQFGVEAQAGI